MQGVKPEVAIVTQTFPPRLGGMEAVMESLALHFAQSDYRVSVFPDRKAESKGQYTTRVIECPRLIRSLLKRLLVNRFITPSTTVICDSWKSVRAVPRKAQKLIVLAHGQEYLKTGRKVDEIREALGRATSVICSSDATRSLVINLVPECTSRCTVIYPTYMLTAKNLPDASDKVSGTPLRLASVCRLEKRKGLHNTAMALARLKDSGLDFIWSIGGSGPEYSSLQALCEKLGLGDQVHFLGRISEDEKDRLLRSSDLFVMPSYQEGRSLEGFGISYIEAAAYGVPSLGGTAGGAQEAVHPPECGWSCDGSDINALEKTLREIFAAQGELRNRGCKAQQRFHAELAGDQVFKQFLSVTGFAAQS